MELKYADKIKCVQSCPPAGVAPRVCQAFRFVHPDINHQNNYRPPEIIKHRDYDSVEEECSALALSFFATAEQARAEFNELKKGNKHIGKRIGDHLATVTIGDNDGMATSPGADGHFDLFESSECNFVGRLAIEGAI